MSCFTSVRCKSTFVLGALLSASLASCAGSNMPSASQQMEAASAPGAPAMEMPSNDALGNVAAQSVAQTVPTEAVPTQPQLIKSAELRMTVDSVEATLKAIAQITQQQQGDILGLQDQQPTADQTHHTATLQLRVPQAKLDAALEAIGKLGTVQQQTLTTEDVSNQLVDLQARLRNLRKTEEMLLEIMERSGSIGDVLNVARELSNVRSSIEQIDAQLSSLQERVAYSTINLSLQEAIATPIPQRATATQLQETWKSAARSFGKVTVDLMQLGIWLMVYSPYLLILAGGAVAYLKFKKQPQRAIEQPNPTSGNS
jgi:hypothetical protein